MTCSLLHLHWRELSKSVICWHMNVYQLLVISSCLSAVFLTFFGLASIGLSCLMALFLYHAVFGVRYLGILNGVAAFVIIGIGKGKEIHQIFH